MTIHIKVTLQNEVVYEDNAPTLPSAIAKLKLQIPHPLVDTLKVTGVLEVEGYYIETFSDIPPVIPVSSVEIPDDSEGDLLIEDASGNKTVSESAKVSKVKK